MAENKLLTEIAKLLMDLRHKKFNELGTPQEEAEQILAKIREVVEGTILDILLQLYNDGFIQGEMGIGNDQEATGKALQAILKAIDKEGE